MSEYNYTWWQKIFLKQPAKSQNTPKEDRRKGGHIEGAAARVSTTTLIWQLGAPGMITFAESLQRVKCGRYSAFCVC